MARLIFTSLLILCVSVCGAAVQHVFSALGYRPTAEASGENWSVKEQNDFVCEAGSRHFAGRINITDEKSMFFWFFESRTSPNDRPVVVWLNGGPGASSLGGLYSEVGPCTIDPDGEKTSFSEDSWTEHANVLFIDQPAGVGLSTLVNGTRYPHNLESSTRDFLELLEVFYSEIFPQYAKNDFYVAGESFGGQYAPRYASTILRRQREGIAGSLQHMPLKGIILVNALADGSWSSLGHYDLFCTDIPPNILRFNETTCTLMANAVPECERLQSLCTTTSNPRICEASVAFCAEQLERYFQEDVENHRHSPYDLRRDCPEPPLCGVGDNAFGSTSDFLNRPGVQRQLGFESPVAYQSINFDLNMQWSLDPQTYVPTTADISYLLNAGIDPVNQIIEEENIVSVLVMNGEYDVTCNLPGAIREYDSMPWHRQADYRAVKDFKPWYWVDKNGNEHEGGFWKGTRQRLRGLELVSVKDAGHMSPGDQRGAVAALFGEWIKHDGLLEL